MFTIRNTACVLVATIAMAAFAAFAETTEAKEKAGAKAAAAKSREVTEIDRSEDCPPQAIQPQQHHPRIGA